MRGLQGKRAVVTGGARGLGRATATRLAEEGVSVAILDLLDDEAAQVAQELRGHGVRTAAIKCDTTDEEQITQAMEGVRRELGGLDILVNNAGIICPRTDWQNWTKADLQRFSDVNYVSYFLVIKAAHAMLKESGHGRIVNVASRTFFMGNPGQTPYVSAKGAVLGLTWNMARELGPDNINVNAAMPGQVATEGTLAYNAEEVFDRTMQNQAIKKRVLPEHFAGLVTFLASDDAAMITGQSFICDGGGYLH